MGEMREDDARRQNQRGGKEGEKEDKWEEKMSSTEKIVAGSKAKL